MKIFNYLLSLLSKNDSHEISSSTEREIYLRLKEEMKIVFDVGVRDELSFYAIKADCEYHLFESNDVFVHLLKKKISGFDKHDIVLNDYGLSDKIENNKIYYEKSQSFIINPTLRGDVDTGKRFSLKTIDYYIRRNKINKVDFLKIDAEGLDYKILVGAKESILSNIITYIQFEYWDGVKKFKRLLSNHYTMFLVVEPALALGIKALVYKQLTPKEKLIDFTDALIPLKNSIVDLIDNKLIPSGLGGNIFCVNKKSRLRQSDLNFKV